MAVGLFVILLFVPPDEETGEREEGCGRSAKACYPFSGSAPNVAAVYGEESAETLVASEMPVEGAEDGGHAEVEKERQEVKAEQRVEVEEYAALGAFAAGQPYFRAAPHKEARDEEQEEANHQYAHDEAACVGGNPETHVAGLEKAHEGTEPFVAALLGERLDEDKEQPRQS